MKKFWMDFLAAYGACWSVMMVLAIFTQSHIDAGEFGFFGFPAFALLFAYVRKRMSTDEQSKSIDLMSENIKLREELAFLKGKYSVGNDQHGDTSASREDTQ